ncbi:uncharacterized protein TNCT_72871, partial [Trichonephila clavata]
SPTHLVGFTGRQRVSEASRNRQNRFKVHNMYTGYYQRMYWKRVEELMANDSVSEPERVLLSIGSLLADLCDVDSSFHKDYMASVDCIARVVDEEPTPECKHERMTIGTEFLNAVGLDDMDENQKADISCLETPATIACITTALQKYCGAAARRAILHIVREFKPMIQAECSSENV